jgi:hypothetical protein
MLAPTRVPEPVPLPDTDIPILHRDTTSLTLPEAFEGDCCPWPPDSRSKETLAQMRGSTPWDIVDEWGRESFPASPTSELVSFLRLPTVSILDIAAPSSQMDRRA